MVLRGLCLLCNFPAQCVCFSVLQAAESVYREKGIMIEEGVGCGLEKGKGIMRGSRQETGPLS